MDWLAGKGSGGWIRRTLPPCPHWEIGTTSHGGKHEQGQGLQALWNTTLEAVDLSYAQRKTSKIHSAKSTDFLIPDFCFKNACLCVYNIEKGRIQTFSASSLSKMRFYFFSFILLCTDFLFLPKRKDIIFELIIFNFQRTKAKKLLQSQVLNERSAGKGPAQGRQCGPLHKERMPEVAQGLLGGGREREGTFIKENGQNICHLATLSYNIFFNPHNNPAGFI